jgi:hypothetical protein
MKFIILFAVMVTYFSKYSNAKYEKEYSEWFQKHRANKNSANLLHLNQLSQTDRY